MKILCLFSILVLLSVSLYSTIINVPADQSTIQAGITAAANTDTVLVQPGTYVENINYNGKNITVGSLFLTTADTSYISTTIIDGDASGRVVTFDYLVDSTAVLSGFTVTNGIGGIFCFYSSPTLHDLIISGNTDNDGGGIHCINSNPTLDNVTLVNNTAFESGGGIFCRDDSDLTLENVTISENYAQGDGGGIYCCYGSDLTLENVTITGNYAQSAGGGFYSSNTSSTLINSILGYNIPEDIIIYPGGSVIATYSDIMYDHLAGTGNISSNPLFVDAANGNFHLQSTSPCIDAGDPASPLDPDGSITDMGAYYYHQYDIPPIAEFVSNTTQGYSPLTVNYNDLSIHGSVPINDWDWDFGDGNNSSLQNPSHEYLLPGIYTVSLTVTDINDSIDIEHKMDYITVFGNDPPASPTNVEVNIVYPDAIISWSVVDTTIMGDPALVGGYVVSYSENEEDYFYLWFTTEVSFVHEFVAQYSTQMFYQVIAIADISREEIQYLKDLNDSHPKIRWSDVHERLEKIDRLSND